MFLFRFLRNNSRLPLLEKVSAFGKLQQFSDFIKINAHHEPALSVQHAIDNMVSTCLHESKILLKPVSIQCVFYEPDHYQLIQIHESQDKSGREYPFVLMGAVKYQLLQSCRPVLPCVLMPVLEFMMDIKQDSQVNTKPLLESKIKDIERIKFEYTKAQLFSIEVDILKTCCQAEWLKTSFKGFNLSEIAAYIIGASAAIRMGHQSGQKHVVFPLSPTFLMASAVFWLQWVETIIEKKRCYLGYTLISTMNTAYLYIWFDKPNIHDLSQWVLCPGIKYERQSRTQGLLSVLEKDQLTLCDLLCVWKKEVLSALSEHGEII